MTPDAFREAHSPAGTRATPLVMRSIKIRCLIAMVIMTGMLVSGFAMTRRTAAEFENDAELIDMIGRQRMLIYRAGLQVESLTEATTDRRRDQLRTRLQAGLGQMKARFETLASAQDLPPAAEQVLKQPPHQLQAEMTRFVGLLQEISELDPDQLRVDHPAVSQTLDSSRGELIASTNALVNAFKEDIRRAHRELMLTNSLMLGVGLLVIAATAMGVFRPMIRQVRNETSRLEAANQLLDQQKQELAAALGDVKMEREDRRTRMRAMASIMDDLREERAALRKEISRRQEIQEELRQKNVEMQQFVNTVSHDLKSPLVTCRGFVGMMKEDAEAGRWDDMLDSVDRIERATVRMGDLIDDLLQLSRIGVIRNDPELIDVDHVVRSIADDLSDRAQEAGASLTVQDELPPVVADRVRLAEVFENLLSNALKYGVGSESPRIHVGGASDGEEIRYWVQDNGPGIAAEFHNKVFGLFQRLRTDCEGTGVGLAAVARIMEVHGGRAGVDSAPEQGATFWVAFPANGAIPPAPEEEQAVSDE